MELKINKKENVYFAVMLIISIPIYVFFFLFIIPICFFFLVVQGIMIGNIKGNGIKVTDKQFPELYNIVKKQSTILGLKKPPKVYLIESGGVLNAFATRFLGFNYVVLYSDLYELAYENGNDVIEFIIGHELGHIKRNHINKTLFTFPAQFIPFLSHAYSRACEYTCDNIGYLLNKEGAEKGILILSAGKKLFKYVDPIEFSNQQHTDSNFWVWLAEKLSYHPHLSKRVMLQKKNHTMDTVQKINTIVQETKTIESKDTETHSNYMPK